MSYYLPNRTENEPLEYQPTGGVQSGLHKGKRKSSPLDLREIGNKKQKWTRNKIEQTLGTQAKR